MRKMTSCNTVVLIVVLFVESVYIRILVVVCVFVQTSFQALPLLTAVSACSLLFCKRQPNEGEG